MAYMIKGDKIPYPDKAGEYCGNCHKSKVHERKDCRIGRPRSCAAGSTEEMEARDYVGLYLLKDQPLFSGSIEILTPEELKEPA